MQYPASPCVAADTRTSRQADAPQTRHRQRFVNPTSVALTTLDALRTLCLFGASRHFFLELFLFFVKVNGLAIWARHDHGFWRLVAVLMGIMVTQNGVVGGLDLAGRGVGYRNVMLVI